MGKKIISHAYTVPTSLKYSRVCFGACISFLSSRKKEFYAHSKRINDMITHLIRMQSFKPIQTLLESLSFSSSKRRSQGLTYIARFVPPEHPESFEQWAAVTLIPLVRSGKFLLYLQMQRPSDIPSHTVAFQFSRSGEKMDYFDPNFMEEGDKIHPHHLSKSISFSLWYAHVHNQKGYDAVYLFSYADQESMLKSVQLPIILKK